MRRRAYLRAGAAAVAGGLAGCLGDAGTTTSTGSATASPGPPAQTVYPDYEWATLQRAAPVTTDTIRMRRSLFRPFIAVFEPGTELTVVNEDGYEHDFTVPRLGVGRTLAGGESTTLVVDRRGTFDYVCTIHPPGMLGRLVVTADPAAVTGTATGDDS